MTDETPSSTPSPAPSSRRRERVEFRATERDYQRIALMGAGMGLASLVLQAFPLARACPSLVAWGILPTIFLWSFAEGYRWYRQEGEGRAMIDGFFTTFMVTLGVLVGVRLFGQDLIVRVATWLG